MVRHPNISIKYFVLFFTIFNYIIVITASPLTTDSVETVSNEEKIAVPVELESNVDDVSKTAAIRPSSELIDDESRSIKVDVINDDSVTSDIIARTDYTPTEEIKEKRSTLMSFLGDSDLRSDTDDLDIANSEPIARKETDDTVAKSADESVNQDQRSDTKATVRSEQDIDESKAVKETDEVGSLGTEVIDERVAPSEESSDDVRTEGRDAEETVELDSPTDDFVRGSRRMLDTGHILENKGRSGENVDIKRTILTPDFKSFNAFNSLGSSSTSRSFTKDLIVPHVHTVLNSPSVMFPNVYGMPTVPNMILNRVPSAEINTVSRSFPFYPDNGSNAQAHTHTHASAETFPYISTQNPMDARQFIPNNFDLLKKLTDASSLPIKPTLFSAENVRPFKLFNAGNPGFPLNMNQYNGPRIRRSERKQ